ncbi:MAG: protein phosphatase 2C domain-containing protein [Deltaproteobacteria bacterium]|nr:protein phosphatase 2C domain-containing protein [Deltaproteobacteria bacterium]
MTDENALKNSSETPENKNITVDMYALTDVGMVRDHNEDNFLVANLSTRERGVTPQIRNHQIENQGSLFVVCDGMGGAAAGEVASEIGVNTIYEIMQSYPAPADDKELAKNLDVAICTAGEKIFEEARSNPRQRGMGTTTTAAVLTGERLIFGQVGDSRAHIIRQGKLVQTTKDQSLVQQLIDAKQLTIEEAKNFERSNIILQALGTSSEVNVDVTSTILKRGDILVMCSDGLSGLVDPADIESVINNMESPESACKTLIKMACDNGGDDNITVITAVFGGLGLQLPDDSETLEYEKFDYGKQVVSINMGEKNKTSQPGKNVSPPPSPQSLAEKTDAVENKVSEKSENSILKFVIPAIIISIALLVWLIFKPHNISVENTDEPVNVITTESLTNTTDKDSAPDTSTDTAPPPLEPIKDQQVISVSDKDTDTDNEAKDTGNSTDVDSNNMDSNNSDSDSVIDSDTLNETIWPNRNSKRKINNNENEPVITTVKTTAKTIKPAADVKVIDSDQKIKPAAPTSKVEPNPYE